MLGKGLESLIPKKNQQSDDQQPQEPADNFREPENFSIPNITEQNQQPKTGGKNFLSPKPAQASGHGVLSEAKDERAEEQASPARWAGRSGLRGKKIFPHQEAIFLIEVEKIKPNPHQPRRDFNEESLKELAASIQEFGILQPLIVSKIEKEVETGTEVEYELIAGERRLMAAKMLGWERVPAIIKKMGQKSNQLEIAITENLQRTDLNPIETARAYAKLQDEFRLTQREIATRLGKSRETIANTLRLLNLPSEIQEALAKNQINESQARLLLVIEDLNQQRNLFQEILNNNLSVRELRQRIRKKSEPETSDKRQVSIDPEIIDFQEKLAELLGAQVKINPPATGEKGGKIVITFYSPEEIQGIIEKLSPNDKVNE
jgi:ParB family chromosome partitioning protein